MSTWKQLLQITLAAAAIAAPAAPAAAEGPGWVTALDSVRVERSGTWHLDQFRYAKTTCLSTRETGRRERP